MNEDLTRGGLLALSLLLKLEILERQVLLGNTVLDAGYRM